MDFKTLFKYRKLYMAVAIILLVTNHAKLLIPYEPVRMVVSYFYCAVDIFFFCSGIGCWFSYTADRDIISFLKRRALRIFPIYFAFMVYWLFSTYLSEGISLSAALANLLGVQWLTGRTPVFTWYVSGLWVIYLGTPIFVAMAEKAATRLRGIVMVLGLLLFSFLFWDSYYYIIIMTRLPIFFVGMLLAAESQRREALTKKEIVLMLALVPVGMALLWKFGAAPETILWDRGMYWYPLLLVTPGLCIVLAYIARALENHSFGGKLVAAVTFVGAYTFEIFLTHYSAQGSTLGHYIVFTVIYATILHFASRIMRRLFDAAGNGLKKLDF